MSSFKALQLKQAENIEKHCCAVAVINQEPLLGTIHIHIHIYSELTIEHPYRDISMILSNLFFVNYVALCDTAS